MPDPPPETALPLGAILAGGRSRRFGSPKALEPLAGRPLLAWTVAAVRRSGLRPVLIANEPELFRGFGIPTRPDRIGGAGPLSGIHAALRWAQEVGRPGALCVACDTPFLPAPLLRRLRERFAASGADAVAAESEGPLGVEPLCAVFRVSCLAEIERRLHAGEHALGDLVAALRVTRLPLAEVRRFGAPSTLFLNVNTREQHARGERLAESMRHPSDPPPVLSIVGKKNSGKTTLTVALAAELRRRGLRVASVKHGHHDFEFDQPGRDSWRHFHEGGVEAVMMVAAGKIAMVMRSPGEEPDPEALIRRFYGGAGYDVVLVEGFKFGPFPKVEVFRRAVHERPIHAAGADPAAARLLAVVTDDPALDPGCATIPFDHDLRDGSHVHALADLVVEWLRRGEEGADGA